MWRRDFVAPPDTASPAGQPVACGRSLGALLDRLTHHVHILEMNDKSYRLTTSKKAQRRSAQERSQIPKPPIEGDLAPKNESTWKHKNKLGLQSPFLLTRLVHFHAAL
jgi:hypothetical protein